MKKSTKELMESDDEKIAKITTAFQMISEVFAETPDAALIFSVTLPNGGSVDLFSNYIGAPDHQVFQILKMMKNHPQFASDLVGCFKLQLEQGGELNQ